MSFEICGSPNLRCLGIPQRARPLVAQVVPPPSTPRPPPETSHTRVDVQPVRSKQPHLREACQQNGAKNRRAGDHIEHDAHEQENSDHGTSLSGYPSCMAPSTSGLSFSSLILESNRKKATTSTVMMRPAQTLLLDPPRARLFVCINPSSAHSLRTTGVDVWCSVAYQSLVEMEPNRAPASVAALPREHVRGSSPSSR